MVYRVTANKVNGAYRTAARDRAARRPALSDSGHIGQISEAEPGARMVRLMDTLPEQQREILVLRVVLGMSAQETGDVIGLRAGAVRVAQSRALTALREALARS
ncbi:sigma factor-like helix-turn-helix DNA-binding protein [Saccharothrix sp.]|uniref:sigma factor-like helix-turn-helix DNA-binding protein n=1 Tax=Saccharothrix sp. TaxID=1873460 RepID=UPI002810FE3A|nr:sigma factor-like helix-turn-helix DNA-binding protein [Saccharothrix sp.]